MGCKTFLLGLLAFLALISGQSFASDDDGVYNVGVGIGDITGPPAGIVLNGYVNPITEAAGIYTRQFARAFVISSLSGSGTVAYVTCDQGMIDHQVVHEVVKKLQEKHGLLFSEKNIMISATHTHSGVSGFMTYYAYLIIESYGFNPVTFRAAVDGITEAISQAYISLRRGKLYWNRGELLGASGNRAETAYLANPESERERYAHNVDVDMNLLKLVTLEEDDTESPLGSFTWWPVHPISFNGGINPLVSSDNKGYAAILMDAYINGPRHRPGSKQAPFVSGFGSSNLGDVSPRHGQKEGPSSKSWDFTPDIKNSQILGTKQFQKAKELFENTANLQPVTGPIRFAHSFIDTTTVSVEYHNETSGENQMLSLCPAALGYSYVGIDPEQSQFWDLIRDFIKEPSPEAIQCQAPKHIALIAGEMDQPWQWAPSIIALQILQIGNFDLVGLPGEYTTMSGRRVRNAIFNQTGHEVVVAGLANNYINYIATPEEYDVEDYEGGATIYGRNTLPVTSTLLAEMARKLMNGETVDAGPTPPYFLEKLRTELDPFHDPAPLDGKPFGSVVTDAWNQYVFGDEVKVIFNGGSPRENPLRGGSFLTVEKRSDTGEEWEVIRTDADLDTLFYWEVVTRRVEVKWFIPLGGVPEGFYRIRHFGHYKPVEGGPLVPYVGVSKVFRVVRN